MYYSSKYPIGFYDSGIGGLTILSHFNRLQQHISTIYFADQAACPLGDKTSQQIQHHTVIAVRHLIEQGCKLVVLVCNTATAHTIRYLQQEWLPHMFPECKVLGIVRPVTEFLQSTLSTTSVTRVGVMATQATIQSKFYHQEIQETFGGQVIVQDFCAPGLADAIETQDTQAITKILTSLFPSKDYTKLKQIHSIILACTHYPIIANPIQQQLQSVFYQSGAGVAHSIQLVSQSQLVATKLVQYMQAHADILGIAVLKPEYIAPFSAESILQNPNLRISKNNTDNSISNSEQGFGTHRYITTGQAQYFIGQIQIHFPHLLQQNASVENLPSQTE